MKTVLEMRDYERLSSLAKELLHCRAIIIEDLPYRGIINLWSDCSPADLEIFDELLHQCEAMRKQLSEILGNK